jgi:uncharacterized membrane protein YgcG
MTSLLARARLCLALLLCLPGLAFAQRDLHWDALVVTAHLNADGSLSVVEDQTIVFNGNWNGGERTFSIRPRQRLSFEDLSRWTGTAWQPMHEHSSLSDVDDYAFTDPHTLRWRSRRAGDPPFSESSMRYQLRYSLAGIVLPHGTEYTLDHDFAFPNRSGVITRYELRLTLDPAWQADTPLRDVYMATNLTPAHGFVLTIPLRYVGTDTPSAIAGSRPPAVRIAAQAIIGLTLLAIVVLLVSESARGRFARIDTAGIDEAWLREHILKFPAELVSAAWDDRINQAEVVTILARMTVEGKLESRVSAGGKQAGMTLVLKVPRTKLTGYERALIDKLFFGNRTTTSTAEVKAHYQKTGFSPVSVIEPDLKKQLRETLPFADASRAYGVGSLIVFVGALVLLFRAWLTGDLSGTALVLLALGSLVLAGLASIPGRTFRTRMDWSYGAAFLCLLVPCAMACGAAAFIWYYVGNGDVELSTPATRAVAALALAATVAAVNALRTRQRREGIAFRKQLAAGRLFFMSELGKSSPALHDDWYPWLLAFDLGKQMDDWSASSAHVDHTNSSTFTSSSGSSSSGSSSGWTGFGGGRSGGAGASATWAAAAGGLAAGVAAPSSSSSGGSGGGGGGGGGSSGGGGGGGW